MIASAYIHFPFCKTKCPYCDFASEAVSPTEFQDRSQSYFTRLLDEIDFRMRGVNQTGVLDTIYFGGGTPSLESPSHISGVLTKLAEYYGIGSNAEITLEANPGTIDRAKLEAFKAVGINRISIGAQTFDEKLLVKLGRGHSLADTYRSLEDIISIGFQSWSLDLIYGLAGQTIESWEQTLTLALKYQPPHISAYALSIEPTTPYGAYYKNSKHPELPIEDDVATMYELAHERFNQSGLARYEISNWAHPGHESRHNLCYWLANEYFAFGLGAHGYVARQRYANPKQLGDYYAVDFAQQERVDIDQEESCIEKILLGLRLERGLELTPELTQYINFQKLADFERAGLLRSIPVAGDDRSLIAASNKQPHNLLSNIKLSTKGILLSNTVIAELIETNADTF